MLPVAVSVSGRVDLSLLSLARSCSVRATVPVHLYARQQTSCRIVLVPTRISLSAGLVHHKIFQGTVCDPSAKRCLWLVPACEFLHRQTAAHFKSHHRSKQNRLQPARGVLSHGEKKCFFPSSVVRNRDSACLLSKSPRAPSYTLVPGYIAFHNPASWITRS